MRICTMIRLACIVALAWVAMPGPTWAGTCTREVLAQELATSTKLTEAQRAALEERLRLLDALAKAKPAPMPYHATPGRAEGGPGALVQFDPVNKVTTWLGSTVVDQGGARNTPGFSGMGLPALVAEGGDGIAGSEAGTLNGCTPPELNLMTWGYPWNTVVKLLMRFNVAGTDHYYNCSAATVHPFHLITAGHCLYNWDPNDDGDESDAKWADEVWAWAAQTDLVNPFACESGCPDEVDHPFGVAKATWLYGYTGWTDDQDRDHDMAYITLDRRIGERVGWMGAEAGVETTALNFDGYPTETPYVPECSVGPYPGYDENNVESYSTYRIEMCAYVYGGHSGGPDWRLDAMNNRYIQGVNSTSDREGSAHATRLTNGKFEDLFVDIIPNDEVVRPPTARPELIEYVLSLGAKGLLDTNVCQGTTFRMLYNAYNVGFANTGDSAVDFYLSPDTCISPSDHLVGSAALGNLPENVLVNPTAALTVPCSVPAGAYYAGWIMGSATPEYNTYDNAAVIADQKLSVTQTVAPTIALDASGGDVNGSCVFLAPYSAVITDDCGVAVGSIQVNASSLDGRATVGTPTVDLDVVSPTEVRVSGHVEVSALTGCPAAVRITVRAEDVCGHPTTESRDIEVSDPIPPSIAVQLDPNELWPPNHRLVTIQATVAASDNCPNSYWFLLPITSSEPEDGLGDGDTGPDITDAVYGTADISFRLRSERSGNGTGRDYTVVYQMVDVCGNTSRSVSHVFVPHDQHAAMTFAGAGFNATGTGFAGLSGTFQLIVLSTAGVDVSTLNLGTLRLGATERTIAPVRIRIADVNCDGRRDLIVEYSKSGASALLPLTGRLSFRYETAAGFGYVVPDIFQLGPPIGGTVCRVGTTIVPVL